VIYHDQTFKYKILFCGFMSKKYFFFNYYLICNSTCKRNACKSIKVCWGSLLAVWMPIFNINSFVVSCNQTQLFCYSIVFIILQINRFLSIVYLFTLMKLALNDYLKVFHQICKRERERDRKILLCVCVYVCVCNRENACVCDINVRQLAVHWMMSEKMNWWKRLSKWR
jgi:hypothetical protein